MVSTRGFGCCADGFKEGKGEERSGCFQGQERVFAEFEFFLKKNCLFCRLRGFPRWFHLNLLFSHFFVRILHFRILKKRLQK